MKKPSSKTKLIKCPGCNVRLPENDLQAQMRHMDEFHSDIIADRRRAAGIHLRDVGHMRPAPAIRW